MNQLQVIEHRNQRVLTTAQLAESFGTDNKNINDNFQNNIERYTLGKHYFSLEGEELKAFKASTQISGNLKFAPVIYLWTEKGAWMHAKSLNTDRAWEAYEMLVDDYYQQKEQKAMTTAEVIAAIANQAVEQERRMKELESRVQHTEQRQEHINEILSLNPTEWRQKVTTLLNRLAQARGGDYEGVRKESYKILEERAKCDLAIRQTNKKRKMALEGVAKSKIDKVSKIDVIADDARLTEVYLAIVKEMAAIRDNVDPS